MEFEMSFFSHGGRRWSLCLPNLRAEGGYFFDNESQWQETSVDEAGWQVWIETVTKFKAASLYKHKKFLRGGRESC
jgi:hypothetical protein